MKLYYHHLSENCHKVLALARELGTDLKLVEVDIAHGAHHASNFAALNPNGMVPLLVHGDFRLWESNAILQYLASLQPTPFWPEAPRSRADVVRWQCWQLAHLTPAVNLVVFERVFKKLVHAAEGPDPEKVAAGEAKFIRFAAVLEQHLEGRSWVVGDHPTLADLSLGAALSWVQQAALPMEKFSSIVAWRKRLCERPAWRDTAPTLPGH